MTGGGETHRSHLTLIQKVHILFDKVYSFGYNTNRLISEENKL